MKRRDSLISSGTSARARTQWDHIDMQRVAIYQLARKVQGSGVDMRLMLVAQCNDMDVAYTRRVEAREAVQAAANPASVQAALCRLFPMPCHSRYVALTLLPQKPLLSRMVRRLNLVLYN